MQSDLEFIRRVKEKSGSKVSSERERFVEDLFTHLFSDIPGFVVSREQAPRLKFHKTLYTDGIVSFNNEVFTVFEFKKGRIKFSENNTLLFNQEENVVYSQAIKYILCSNSELFSSELKFNEVFLFNGSQIAKISIRKENLEKIFEILKWNDSLNAFLNGQHNLSSYLQDVILSSFNTIRPLIDFKPIIDFQSSTSDSDIFQLYKELTDQKDAKINIMRINLKEKYLEYTKAFDEEFLLEESKKYPQLTNIVLRSFIEISVHLNGGIHCVRSLDGKIVDFQVDGQTFSIYHTEENDLGEMVDKPITIFSTYIKDLERLNDFLQNHVINNLDILYENYDSLISDERTRKSIGLYFTKSQLSHLCYEFMTRTIPVDILKLSHFYDPAAGSGNLLKSQEDFLTVIGSDIKKMSQDIMKNRHINVPRKEIDFIQSPRQVIIDTLNALVKKNGRNFIDNPLIIIMNPPYRGKNTWVEQGQIGNKNGVSRDDSYLDTEFLELLKTNNIRSNDLSSFFILKALTFYLQDKYYGYIATFSPTNWLNPGRMEHDEFRKYISKNAKFIGGFIVNGTHFFDNLNSNLAIAFSIFQLDKQSIPKDANEHFSYFDLYKDNAKIDEMYNLRQYKNWEPSYLDNDETSVELKKKYLQLSDKLFQNSKLIDFTGDAQPKVYFKDIFRAINSQTGDDEKVLLHTTGRISNLDLDSQLDSNTIVNSDIYLVATDKATGYDVAVKPKEKKTKGCVFSIPRDINAPIMAWHYLWDYLATYPSRFYNAVPITRKYAFTFIDQQPLLNLHDVEMSRSCKSFNFIKKNPSTLQYITDWQKNIGDLRGLFFFFFALTKSDKSAEIAKNVLFKNSPIWCPDLKMENVGTIKKIIQLGTAYSMYKFASKFEEFELMRHGEPIVQTINYFSVDSSWFKKSQIAELILNSDPDNAETISSIVRGEKTEAEIKQLINSTIRELSSY